MILKEIRICFKFNNKDKDNDNRSKINQIYDNDNNNNINNAFLHIHYILRIGLANVFIDICII